METKELLERARAVNRLPPPRERRRIREAAGATQRELAGVLEVGVMTLNRWERGLTRPRGRKAVAYAALLEQLDDA